MEPSFFDKEYILTDKISYRFREPKRGEVIIFRAPKNQELDYIKRIIGLPGEKIKINTEGIFVNGQKLEESYLGESGITFSGPFLQLGQDLLVPQGEYFVLGDNRTHSSDSREWGTVSRPDIIGHAWMIYWPPKRFGIIKEIAY